MAKSTLGYFYDNNKKYKLFYRLGYGKYKNFIYIGNSTKGNMFRFHKDEDNIILFMMKKETKDGWGNLSFNRKSIPLYIPKSEDDLRFILEMILNPQKCELVELNITSREKLKHEIFKQLVITRLKG